MEGAEVAAPKKAVGDNASNATARPIVQARSLAILSQVVVQLERYVQSKDLSAIHNEDVILSAAASELLAQADTIASNQGRDFKTSLTTFCSRVSALHLVADLNQQANAETELGKVLESFSKVKAHFPKEVIASAQVYLETFTCPMHRDVVGKRTDFCPKCGMALDQLPRILPPNSGFPLPGEQTVRASISTTGPLTVGEPVAALLQLQRSNGGPVLPADLIETQTKKIHLLIVDGSLTDYHHEHPVPTRNPGEYSFSFTPAKPGGYRVWADVSPYPLGLQEYAMTDIPATTAGEPLTNRAVNFKVSVDGLSYELIFAQKTIQVGRPATARLRITSADGKGFTQLEPLMATFAHLVGFNQDYKTVMHMHPKGAPILDPAARGGPGAGVSDLCVAARLRSSLRSSADRRPFTIRSLRPPDRAMNSGSMGRLSPLTGGYYCGKVRFRASGATLYQANCHCANWRRAAGAQAVASITVKLSEFVWEKGEPKRYKTDAGAYRTFCDSCGTSLTYENAERPKEIDITTGSLDGREHFPPNRDVFPEEKLSWVDLVDGS